MVATPRRSRIHNDPRTGANSAWTREWHRNVTSQAGQDGVIERIFEIMPPRTKYCVEFGAWDGKHLSNTWNLINNHAWSAAMIEGDPDKAAQLADRYRARKDVTCINRFVGFDVGVDTLDAILAGIGCPQDLDFMSIDIDGNDWHVWNSLEKYRPRLLIIEYNPTASNDLYYVQRRDFVNNKSNSLLALMELGKEKGYELISADHDAYFVQKEDFHLFPTGDNDINFMNCYTPSFHFYQGFDGSMLMSGAPKLIWQDFSFDESDIQVVPEKARKLWWID